MVLTVYLFLDIFRPEILFDAANGENRVLLWIGATALIVWILESLVTGRRWRPAASTPFAFGMLAVALLSSGLAFIREGGDQMTKFLDLAKSVYVYFLVVQTVDTERRLSYLRTILVIFILGLALGGVMYSRGYMVPGFNYDRSERLQYVGILNDSNDLALVYVAGWAIVLFNMVHAPGFFRKVVLFLCLVPLAWAIVLTASRGAMLASMAAVIVVFRSRLGKVLLPAILGIGAVLLMNHFGVARMDKLSSDEESAEQRIVSWGQGWYMLRSNPLLGIGPRNYTEYHNMNAHSTIVQVGAEAGMLGLFCWLGFYYFPLQEFTKWRWLRSAEGGGAGPPLRVQEMQSALIASFVASLFLSRLYINTQYLLVGMVMAARALPEYEAEPEGEPEAEDGSNEVAYKPTVSLWKLASIQLLVLITWRVVVRQFVTGI
jgi:O-antigen ligase